MKRFSIVGAVLVVIFVLAMPAKVKAQKEVTGIWYGWFGNKIINEKWSFWNEVQFRFRNGYHDPEQLLPRVSLNYHLPEGSMISLGYAHIGSWNRGSSISDGAIWERRIYQQFLTRQRISRVHLLHRYRIEQRWMSNDFKFRFRYFLSLNIPLTDSEMKKGVIYASAYNEVFIQDVEPGLDRNRIYLGIGKHLGNKTRVEFAYMQQLYETTYKGQLNLMVFRTF